MNKKLLRSFFVILILFLVGLFFIIRPVNYFVPRDITHVKIAGQNLKAILALTPEEHEHGLSGRESLESDEGMLFVFEKVDKYYFWMKGMKFSIDMIWIDENMKVFYIKENAKPEDFMETYGPDIDTKYVLEVNAGFSNKNNLKVGDSVIFTY